MLSCACYYWHVVTTRGSSQLFAPPASCCASSVVEENVSYAQVNPEAPKAIPRSNLALSFIVELCPRWEIMNIKVQMWGIMLDIPGGCRYFESSSFVSNLQVCSPSPPYASRTFETTSQLRNDGLYKKMCGDFGASVLRGNMQHRAWRHAKFEMTLDT